METYTGYSEQELADKVLISKYCCISDENVPFYVDHFSDPSRGEAGMVFNIVPTGRCSDGKRRLTCVEYIDFLFQSPTIEDCIDNVNASPDRNFIVILDFSNRMLVDVRMKLRTSTPTGATGPTGVVGDNGATGN